MAEFYTIYKSSGTAHFNPAENFGFIPFWEHPSNSWSMTMDNISLDQYYETCENEVEIARFADKAEALEYLDKFVNTFDNAGMVGNKIEWQYAIYVCMIEVFDEVRTQGNYCIELVDHELCEFCSNFYHGYDYDVDVASSNSELAGSFLNYLNNKFEQKMKCETDIDYREFALYRDLSKVIEYESYTTDVLDDLFTKTRIKARLESDFLNDIKDGCINYHDVMSISELYKR